MSLKWKTTSMPFVKILWQQITNKLSLSSIKFMCVHNINLFHFRTPIFYRCRKSTTNTMSSPISWWKQVAIWSYSRDTALRWKKKETTWRTSSIKSIVNMCSAFLFYYISTQGSVNTEMDKIKNIEADLKKSLKQAQVFNENL